MMIAHRDLYYQLSLSLFLSVFLSHFLSLFFFSTCIMHICLSLSFIVHQSLSLSISVPPTILYFSLWTAGIDKLSLSLPFNLSLTCIDKHSNSSSVDAASCRICSRQSYTGVTSGFMVSPVASRKFPKIWHRTETNPRYLLLSERRVSSFTENFQKLQNYPCIQSLSIVCNLSWFLENYHYSWSTKTNLIAEIFSACLLMHKKN